MFNYPPDIVTPEYSVDIAANSACICKQCSMTNLKSFDWFTSLDVVVERYVRCHNIIHIYLAPYFKRS